MSKFFAETDSETESEVSEEERLPTGKAKTFSFSDDEEESKRTVRSAKVKRFEEIKSVVKSLKNSRKIKDVAKVADEFDQLTKVYVKSQKVIEKEGMPTFFIRTLVNLEDFIKECWEIRDKLSVLNKKALGTLRSKFRKYILDFKDPIEGFRQNPIGSEDEKDLDESEDESEDESKSGDESEVEVKAKKPVKSAKGKAAKAVESDDESDTDDWGSSESDDTTSSSDDEDRYKNDPAARFLKREGDDKKEKAKKEKVKPARQQRVKIAEIDDEGFTRMVDKPRLFTKETEITHPVILKKLGEVQAVRGKKSTDRREQIELIEELRTVARRANLGPAIEIKLVMALVSSIFDSNPNVASNMKSEMWKRLLEAITELLKLLMAHTEVNVGEHIPEDDESYIGDNMRISGAPLNLIERMDDEFVKILQNCDAHSPEYLQNLTNETKVNQLIEHMQLYLEATDAEPSEKCRIYERRVNHIYYKVDGKFMEAQKNGSPLAEPTSLDVMDELCAYIYNHDETDRIRLRAILMRVYHLALHDQWYAARDLLLMSKAQETIHHSDPPTQVLYNRAMVQLGISAFRKGNINEAHNALMDIQSSGRPKELLAQGLLPVRQHERSAEQEKIEKRRQIPFHQHINLDVLECVYLVSAMFIEVPYLAAHENDQRRRIISKYFYHSMKQSERHALSGPPETLPEYVIAGSKAMKTGDWKKCREFILSEKLNKRVWDFFYAPDRIRELIGRRVQECSLRCFMFTNSAFYDAISVQTLSEMFELKKDEILGLIGKMIVTEDLAASVDEPSQTVIMHRTEPSRVQQLALQLADKLTSFVESNERMLEMKTPGQFQRPQNRQWVDRRQQQYGGGDRYYNQQQQYYQQHRAERDRPYQENY